MSTALAVVVCLGACLGAGCVRPPAAGEAAPAATTETKPETKPDGKPETKIDFVERLTNGAQAGDRLPTIVVLHGFGGTPEKVLELLDGLHIRARLLGARGLFPAGSGYGWFSVHRDPARDESAPAMKYAADAIARGIKERSAAQPTCGRPIVLGFSQGAMLSYALAAQSPSVVGLALPMGGLLPPALSPQPGQAHGALPTVIAMHGDADPRVPIEGDRETWARFAAAGYAGGLREYAGVQHAISPEMKKDLVDAIEHAVREAGCAP